MDSSSTPIVTRSGDTGSLAAALVELQRDPPEIVKAQHASVTTKEGRAYSYQYAGLDVVSKALLPRLATLGCYYTCSTRYSEGRFWLEAVLEHAASGDHRTAEWPLPTTGSPQAIGASVAYGRRYMLLSLTGVAPAGDDTDAAPEPTRARRAPRTASKAIRADRESAPAEDGLATDAEFYRMMDALRGGGWKDSDKAGQIRYINSATGKNITSRKAVTSADVAMVLQALAEGASDDHSERPS